MIASKSLRRINLYPCYISYSYRI